jgi:hypothetical protein
MKVCKTCKVEKPNNKFAGKSEHCRDCDTEFVQSVMEVVRGFYQPEYPPHIQEYLDNRRKQQEEKYAQE